MASYEAKVTSKGQITLPAQLREDMRIATGDKVVFTLATDGAAKMTAKNRRLTELRGIIRSGGPLTGGDIARMIDEARASRVPDSALRASSGKPKR